jgi:hypothetical protein
MTNIAGRRSPVFRKEPQEELKSRGVEYCVPENPPPGPQAGIRTRLKNCRWHPLNPRETGNLKTREEHQ